MEGEIGHLIVDRLLSWPTYLFIALMIVLVKYGDRLSEAIASRKIDVDIAGNKISIGEAIEGLNETALDDFRRHQEQIDGLEKRLDKLEAAAGGEPKSRSRAGPPPRDEIFQRMLAVIAESKATWRSIERLAIEAGVSVQEAHDILAEHPNEVVLGKDKLERPAARLP